MKNILNLIVMATAFCSLINIGVAQEQAIVTRDRVNVRGQPSVFSEVLTQLNKGDKITIIEPVKVEKPKEGDNANWYKIQLPAGVPVWVNVAFINTNFNTVIPNRLNIRAGCGEQYSILGRLEKGTVVKIIKTENNWYQIETPTNAYGFIVAEFVEKQAATPKVEDVKPAIVPIVQPEPEKTEKQETPQKTDSDKVEKPADQEKPAEKEKPAGAVEPATTDKKESAIVGIEERPLVKQEADAKERVLALIQGKTSPQPKPVVEVEQEESKPAGPPPRIVTREGYVRGTLNIQSPSPYVLQTIDTGKTINYLYTTSTNISLKNFKGKRVIVTGKEAIDSRWPNMPVLTISTIKEVEEESNATR